MSRFTRYKPSDILKPYVRCLAISEQDHRESYKVLPDTSLVMGFQYSGRLSHRTGNTATPLAVSGITGLQDRFAIFQNSDHTGTILVYFTETGASFFFSHPLHELFAQSVSLEHFIGQSLLDSIHGQLAEAQTDRERISVLEAFLISQLRFSPADLLVTTAIQHIYESKGTIRIKQLAKDLYTSQSPLEKRFRKIVGASPKKFASIVRLQSLITGYSATTSFTSAAYASGYYDQAHFIKDFRQFTGETPEKFFLSK